MKTELIGIALATLTLTMSAYANVMFALGNNNINPADNIVAKATATVGPGTPIDGTVPSRPDVLVQFESDQDTMRATNGHASIVPAPPSTFIHDITVTTPGFGFTRLILDPRFPRAGLDLMYTVLACVPMPHFCVDLETFTDSLHSNNGQNYMTLTTSGGEVMYSVTIDSMAGMTNLDHVTIATNTPGGLDPIPPLVPEPSSLLLLGSGVLGLAQLLRRKVKTGPGGPNRSTTQE
jgi:hypothetical protein